MRFYCSTHTKINVSHGYDVHIFTNYVLNNYEEKNSKIKLRRGWGNIRH